MFAFRNYLMENIAHTVWFDDPYQLTHIEVHTAYQILEINWMRYFTDTTICWPHSFSWSLSSATDDSQINIKFVTWAIITCA